MAAVYIISRKSEITLDEQFPESKMFLKAFFILEILTHQNDHICEQESKAIRNYFLWYFTGRIFNLTFSVFLY